MRLRVSHRPAGSRRARTGCLGTVAAVLALAVVLSPSRSHAEEAPSNTGFFFGTGAGILTLVYTPLKLAYAVTSVPLGGLVYMWTLGNSEAAERVLHSGTRGTFVLTPDHLKGDQDINFMGTNEPEEEPEESEEPSG